MLQLLRKTSIGLSLLAVLLTPVALAEKPPAKDRQGALSESQQQIRDAYIVGRLNSAYALNEHLSPFEIDVDSDQSMVTLSGEVDSAIAEDLAVEIARGVPEVVEVSSKLKVVPESSGQQVRDEQADGFSQTVKDASLTAKVKTRLLTNRHVSALSINVDTRHEVVTLKGEVDTDAERDLAEQLADNTPGVAAVHNHLEVVSR